MKNTNDVLKKLQALDESEVSKADQVILEFCYNFVKQESENRRKQEVMFSAVLQALGRRLGVDNQELKDIYMSTNNYINEHWDEINEKIEDDEEFARIIGGILDDKEDGGK